ncbi:MAG: penicillin-binding protein 2 [Acidimicrobiaceae bacterium]
MNPDNPRLRLSVLGVVIVSLFAALFARLWYLQVLASQEFQRAASANSQRVILEEAPRGRILDRNGVVLVGNEISTVVTIDRSKLPAANKSPATQLVDPARVELLDRLASEITHYRPDKPIDRAFLEKRIADVRYSPYTPVPVAEQVPKELELFLDEHHLEFGPAVAVTSATVRTYPYGRVASHVLGYLGAITPDELAARANDPKTYQLGNDIGREGVERTYESELRGVPGKRVLEVDAKGNTVGVLSSTPPIPGNDVQLTIDANVQAVTEQSLKDELANAHNRQNSDKSYNPAPAGAAVVLDATNGQVIAMASYPDYDPRDFVNGISSDKWDLYNNDPNVPLNNRALYGLYAPGSTFKLLTAYAALKSGAITGATTINDRGSYTIPNCKGQCTFTNAQNASHGLVNLPRALTVSSDVYFYQLGARFDQERGTLGDPMDAAATAFGFAQETGIPLPGEQVGFVPTKDKSKARHDANPTAFPKADWFVGDNINLAIGQGDLVVTPLQLADAYSAFANGGTLYSPNIAMQILAPGGTGQVVRTIDPRTLRTIDMPPEVRDPIYEGLIGVTQQKDGTAYGSFLGFPAGWTVAGKTGTAQVQGKTDTALFAGFGPAENPKYVAVSVLEQSGFGARAAAPVVRTIFEPLADPSLMPTLQIGGTLSKPLTSVDPGAAADVKG